MKTAVAIRDNASRETNKRAQAIIDAQAELIKQQAVELEQAKSFIRSLLTCVDSRDGTIQEGTRINVHKAERIAGVSHV